jgi:hypothetical protein
VAEDIPHSDSPAFPTDGRLYVFSTLRPPPAPDGSLRLIAFFEIWVHGLVFAAIAVVGLLLVRRPLAGRLVAVGMVLAALVLAGVFWPTFFAVIFDGALFSAIFLVLALWFIASAVGALSRRGAARAAAAAAPQAATPAEPQSQQQGEQSEPPSEDRTEDSSSKEKDKTGEERASDGGPSDV